MDREKALTEVLASLPATCAVRLRAILPEIDRRIREGVRHDEIVAALNANGFELNLGTFRKTLYRWRKKERRVEARLSKPVIRAVEPPLTMGASPRASTARAPHEPPIRDRPDLDAVLDRAKRDELGERYLARARPIFKPKGAT